MRRPGQQIGQKIVDPVATPGLRTRGAKPCEASYVPTICRWIGRVAPVFPCIASSCWKVECLSRADDAEDRRIFTASGKSKQALKWSPPCGSALLHSHFTRAELAGNACGSRIILKNSAAHHTLSSTFSHLKPFGTGAFWCGPISFSLHSRPSFCGSTTQWTSCLRALSLPPLVVYGPILSFIFIRTSLRTKRRNHRSIPPRWHSFVGFPSGEAASISADFCTAHTCNGVFPPKKTKARIQQTPISPAIGSCETPSEKSIVATFRNRLPLPQKPSTSRKIVLWFYRPSGELGFTIGGGTGADVSGLLFQKPTHPLSDLARLHKGAALGLQWSSW